MLRPSPAAASTPIQVQKAASWTGLRFLPGKLGLTDWYMLVGVSGRQLASFELFSLDSVGTVGFTLVA